MTRFYHHMEKEITLLVAFVVWGFEDWGGMSFSLGLFRGLGVWRKPCLIPTYLPCARTMDSLRDYWCESSEEESKRQAAQTS